jgi:hypothetical protein
MGIEDCIDHPEEFQQEVLAVKVELRKWNELDPRCPVCGTRKTGYYDTVLRDMKIAYSTMAVRRAVLELEQDEGC